MRPMHERGRSVRPRSMPQDARTGPPPATRVKRGTSAFIESVGVLAPSRQSDSSPASWLSYRESQRCEALPLGREGALAPQHPTHPSDSRRRWRVNRASGTDRRFRLTAKTHLDGRRQLRIAPDSTQHRFENYPQLRCAVRHEPHRLQARPRPLRVVARREHFAIRPERRQRITQLGRI